MQSYAPVWKPFIRQPTTKAIHEFVDSLTPREKLAMLYDWNKWARPSQVAPDLRKEGKNIWMLQAGRGFGKTRVGAEFIRRLQGSGRYNRFNLVGETAADARDTMVLGDSGILAIYPPGERPEYKKSLRRITWNNGAYALLFSAEDPEQLRGPQCDGFWADEVGKWKHPDAWDQLMFGFRIGEYPEGCITTTPRPTKLIKSIVNDPNVTVTYGATYENRANLAKTFLSQIVRRYEGTRLGRQELLGILLTDTPGALWTYDMIEQCRVEYIVSAATKLMIPLMPEVKRTIISIDPAVTADEDSDETGIVAISECYDGNGYVREDRSGQYSPAEWADKALDLYYELEADLIVAETNNGGDMVGHTIRTRPRGRNVPFRKVWASRGKRVRAEPISALYEQRRIKHMKPFPELEDELTTWVQGMDSPNRLDAMVHGATALFFPEQLKDGDDETAALISTDDAW